MSRTPSEDVNLSEVGKSLGTVDHQHPTPGVTTKASQEAPSFVDGSGPIFSMYSERAMEDDEKMAESWKADAEGILVFTGLFSAAVASLISVSIQDIRPNPQDTSNFYLANIYQTLANPNQSDIFSSLPASPPPFSPPKYAVWVNALWFLSLVIGLTCALLATLLQRWARRYLKVTQPRYSPHKRARIHAFFFEGVDKFLLPWVVEALPALLHVSLFLFFAGVSVFLWNIHLTISNLVLSWIGVCTALYGCITFVPIFHHDSPYHTPLSLPARHIITGISYVIFRALRRLAFLDYFSAQSYHRFKSLEERHRKLLVQGMQKTAEETALNAPSEIDTRAFLWTFDGLDEDHELERFFSGLPGFRSSKVVDDPLPHLTEEQREKLSLGLMGLLDVTFSSDLLSELVKDRRAIICAKACDPAHIPVSGVFDRIWSRCQYSAPMSAEIVQIMRGWGDNRRNHTDLVAAVCKTVARIQRRDDSWFILASDELGIHELVLREYAAHGDSLSLTILIHVTRQQFIHLSEPSWPSFEFLRILETTSRFDVQDTSSELQHGFCALWNQIVLKAQSDSNRVITGRILRAIRNIYVSLHRDTDSAPTQFSASTGNRDHILWDPSSYPVCSVAAHIHDDSTFTCTVLDDDAAPAPAALANPDAPSSSIPASLHVVESLVDVPLLDNLHPTHQTTTESLRIPASSPDSATADVSLTPGIIMPHPQATPTTSTSALPLSSPSTAISHNADILAPSASSNLPSSVSSNLVLNNALSTGVPPSPHLPTTRSDLSPPFPESHRSLSATTAPRSPLRPTSALNLGVASEDDGSPRLGSHKENDALDPPSVGLTIYPNTMALDRLLPPLSLPLVAHSDVAIVGPSLREPNTERTGDHHPHPSYYPDDIV